MARRGNDIPEVLVTLDELVTKCAGYPPEIVRGKIRDSELLETWDHLPAIPASRAREIRDEFVAVQEENSRWNAENIARQLDRELEGRMAPVRAWEAAEEAARSKVKGIEVTVPGEGPEPDWASGEGSDE